MRRLASAFSLKRNKAPQNSDNDHRADSSFSSSKSSPQNVKRATTIPSPISTPSRAHNRELFGSPPSLTTSVSSNPSFSSTGSRLLTPVDEAVPANPPPRKKAFSWFSSKRASRSAPKLSITEPPPVTLPPKSSTSQPAKISQPQDSDTSESEQEDEEDDEGDLFAPRHPQGNHSETITWAKSRLRAISTNGLIQHPSSSPFYHAPTAVSFPRSCHPTKSLPTRPTQQMRVHKARLKAMLDTSDSFGVDPRLLSSFAKRPVPTLIKECELLDGDEPMPEQKRVTACSAGFDRWIARGTFEALHVEWIPAADGTITRRVISCANAVADLEFSAHLESIVMLGDERATASPTQAPTSPPIKSSPNSSTSSLSHTPSSDNLMQRGTPYAAAPSPLRMGHAPSSVGSSSPKQSLFQLGNPDLPALSSIALVPAAKRGVRFAEDDKEDVVPLSYVVRMKQKKAEKAKFLKEEAEKRQFQIEKARVEAERRQREEERQQWERERVAWEKEKKKAEEERKARLYAEELAMARQRRESFRTGHAPHRDSPLLPAAKDSSARSIKSESPRHSRPIYDNAQFPHNGPHSRRPVSDNFPVPLISTSGMPMSVDGNPSPASSGSRPSSLTGFPHSRTPSHHTTPMTSVEDIRASTSSAGKRHSVATSHSQEHSPESLASMPHSGSWSGGHIPMIPPIPHVPFYMNVAMDPNTMAMMPLLPPTPPFMAQQYHSRSRSRQSSPGAQRNNQSSSSSSVDRVHQGTSQTSSRRGSSNASLTSLQVPSRGGSVSSSTSRTHERRPSGDSSRNFSSERGRRSLGRPSDGRGSNSQTYFASPWTGIPSSADTAHSSQRKPKPAYLA